ncbi:MAG: DNA repair protein RadA [Dehalococcoidia bacterium]|nr:DNA repair protein RadA [Dehalococcoidia bacterium]
MDKARKTVFICQQCGKESLKWLGRCPGCQSWNSLVETTVSTSKTPSGSVRAAEPTVSELSQVSTGQAPRLPLPFHELNRVLGGGIVPGSLILISGDPGIGKSTLLLQMSAMIAGEGRKVVYASGEESLQQTKLRADRLGIKGEGLFIIPETDLEAILQRMAELSPTLGVIDSIQTVFLNDLEGAAGSVSQVRGCTLRLMQWAKPAAVPILIVGHVTKEGAIAGPKVLEHMVDVVLYLEGESFSSYRLLRCVKNRFGSTNEVGVFEMKEHGLVEVENPAEVFLSHHSQGAVGSVVTSTLEGTRPLLVEIQALTSVTSFGLPRRTANGIDLNRLLLIIAVLSRRAGLRLSNQDIIVNAVGGLKTSEPAADLAVALAIASSFRDKEVERGTVVIGELGLSGEVRGIPQMERRIADAARQGFNRCLGPAASLRALNPPQGMEIVPVETLGDALQAALGR